MYVNVECHRGLMRCLGSTCVPIPDDVLREEIVRGERAPCPTAAAGGIQPWMKWLAIGLAVAVPAGLIIWARAR